MTTRKRGQADGEIHPPFFMPIGKDSILTDGGGACFFTATACNHSFAVYINENYTNQRHKGARP